MTTPAIVPVGDQLELDMQPLVIPPHVEGATWQERFESFHDLNPWVATALEQLVDRWLNAGHTRVGLKMLVEQLRWHYGLRHGRRTVGDAFQLNNSYTSRYVRLLLDRHPEWADAGVFDVRRLTAL